jgi:NAD(P)-dependent dehydrogenase (short-subunit alcohol dehydrogenase family)
MAEKVALVTGGSVGIGKAICAGFLAAGYQVISLANRPAEIVDPAFHAISVDLADPKATAEAAADATRRFAVTTLVHNAGAIRPALLAEVKPRDLAALFNLHVAAAVSLAQAALPSMRQAGFGRIVLISSRAVLGLATRTSYSATKAGMIGMARTWALELGPEGITVNVVAPGPIETEQFYETLRQDGPNVAQITQSIPVRRLGQPADVARVVLFLAAPESGFITGQVLYVCGGTSVGSLVL